MITSTPKTLKAALGVIAALQEEISQHNRAGQELLEERREAATNYQKERQSRLDSQTERDETRTQFADLKERLLNAETELSRLRGYLARVHEDDVVRDGLVEIEDQQGKRSVPRRQPPMMNAYPVDIYRDAVSALNAPYGREQKRTHWTSY